MALFGNVPGSGLRKKRTEALRNERPDAVLDEELAELTAARDPREVDRIDSEVEKAVLQKTQDEIRDIKVIEQGRCPNCRSRTENFLYTVLCPSCGWYRRSVPDSGRSRLHLNDGETIECDYVHRTRDDEYLLIRDGVVVGQVMRRFVVRVDYVWEPGELEAARERLRRRRVGICCWCEKDLTVDETVKPDEFVDYVAFGAMQERYVFCSEKCMREFRKRYPSRIHRNCYETDCSACDQCIKRYDVDGFRRLILR